jgi:site-specific recombinase XerD
VADSLTGLLASFRRDLRADGKADRTVDLYCESVGFYIRWLESNDSGGANAPHRASNDAADLSQMTQPDANATPDTSALSRELIRNWLTYLRDERGSSPGTRRTRFAGMRRFCRWAAAEGFIPASPMDGMTPPEPPMDPVPVLTDGDVSAMLKTCGSKSFYGLRDAAIIRVLYDTGMRIGELRKIAVDDVDFDLEVIVITGKGSRVRACPFGARTARALDRYLRARRAHAYAASPALWLSQRGAMSTDGIERTAQAPRAPSRSQPRARASVPAHVLPQLARRRRAGTRPDAAQRVAVRVDARPLRRVARRPAR